MTELEYFYAGHSAFAYIGSKRLYEIASEANCPIIHKPNDLRKVIEVNGPGPQNGKTPERRAYFSRREIERWAEFRGVEIMCGVPTYHHNEITTLNSVLIAGILQGHNIDLLAHTMLEAHWRDDADLADEKALSDIIVKAKLEPKPILDAAGSPEVAAVYAQNTEEAIERSVFGSPTYFVDGDMFYGQDHLELIERALENPFKQTWPKD